MNNEDKYIKQVIDGFQKYKGKASVYCFSNAIIPKLVYSIIVPFVNKHPSKQILIIVDCYNTRRIIYEYLNNQNINIDNGYNLKIISADYIKEQYRYSYLLTIIIGVNDNLPIITKLSNESHFTLCVFTKNIMDSDFIMKVRNILLPITTIESDIAIRQDKIYSPVEEHRYGVDLSITDKETYDKYTEYINICISIFGDLYNIEKCKNGDNKLGISAVEFRNNLAKENGWREDLDVSIPLMRQIDDIYNPNTLYEKACNFYTIAKQRRDLLTDNEAKLEIIKDICLANTDKQILIVSKRGEYAAKVTNYLNKFDGIKCGNYHDCIDDAIAVDANGKPILIKSGDNKGKPRILGHQSQSSLNEQSFRSKIINTLSIKSASNTKLQIACDLVIFTSSLCDNIIKLRSRFANITFTNTPTKTYRLYCNNTIENEKLNKEKEISIVTVINDTENFVDFDENSGNIIL